MRPYFSIFYMANKCLRYIESVSYFILRFSHIQILEYFNNLICIKFTCSVPFPFCSSENRFISCYSIPPFPRYDFGNRLVRYSEYFRYIALRFACFNMFTNISYIGFRKFVIPMFHSFFCKTFRNKIAHIIFMCSKPKMFWIHTGRIVTGMAYIQSFWNWAIINNPRKSMCFYFNLFRRYLTVPIMISTFYPRPARIRITTFIKSFKESLFELFGYNHGFNFITLKGEL